MIIATTELLPRNDQRKAMLEVLEYVREHVAMLPECLASVVYEAADGSRRILYLEQWMSERGLHACIKSPLYLRLLNALELASERPVISFHEVSKTRSMDLIEELRISRRTAGID